MVFPPNLTLLSFIMGAALVLFGRKIYLFSIGILGFLVGLYLFSLLNGSVHDWKTLLVALLVGAGAALLSYFLQRAAWALAGFCGGGLLVIYLADLMKTSFAESLPLFFVIGGILGAVVLFLVMDWALIILTSLTGAYLISYQVYPGGIPPAALFLLLVFTGILLQGRSLRASRRRGISKRG